MSAQTPARHFVHAKRSYRGRGEWLPQEGIVFDAAKVAIATRVDLEGDAVFLGWDIVSLGRTAVGERCGTASFRQKLELARDGRLLWCEASTSSSASSRSAAWCPPGRLQPGLRGLPGVAPAGRAGGG